MQRSWTALLSSDSTTGLTGSRISFVVSLFSQFHTVEHLCYSCFVFQTFTDALVFLFFFPAMYPEALFLHEV